MAYIIGGDGQVPDRTGELARTAKASKKGRRPRVAGKKKGSKSWACWRCGGAMRKKGLLCTKCRRSDPVAAKSQLAMVAKSLGGVVKPVAVPKAAKPPRPRCPNPACRATGSRSANCCTRCSAPFTPLHAARAEKSARQVQLSIAGSAEYWRQQAMRQHDPEAREHCYAEARRALQARGTEHSDLVRLLVKSSGARSVREAWLREADPRAREVLRAAMNQNGGRSA